MSVSSQSLFSKKQAIGWKQYVNVYYLHHAAKLGEKNAPKVLIFLMLLLCRFWLTFAQISDLMAQKKNTLGYWLLFFVSTAALITAIATHFSYLPLILPFFCTSFVKAMDIM